MVRAIKVGDMGFSAQTPRICVPLSGTSLEEVLWELRSIADQPVDMVEWRADFFKEDIRTALPLIKKAAGLRPVLFTLRSLNEGGNKARPDYESLLTEILQFGAVPMVDIEFAAGDAVVRRLVALAKAKGVVVVMSAHFFSHTPKMEELVALFGQMEAAGADIPKIAVMPKDFADTLTLMQAAHTVSQENAPLIAIAMGAQGGITRLCPGAMGSCLSFAAGKLSSAPGQMRPGLVRQVMDATNV